MESPTERRKRLTRRRVQRNRQAADEYQRQQRREADQHRRMVNRQQESDAQHSQRLANLRRTATERRALENPDEREMRLTDLRQRAATRLELESADDRYMYVRVHSELLLALRRTSPRKFKDVMTSKTAANSITLDQLQTVQNYQHVTVVIKVLRADAKIEIKPGLCKQDLCISDATGTARLTVWQDTIGTLQEGQSYKLEGLMVSSFDNKKYLTPPKSGCTITPQQDIGAVEDMPDDEQPNVIDNAEVAAVSYIGSHSTCLSCSGKVEALNDYIGRCGKCNATQRLDKCPKQLSTKLFITAADKSKYLHAFLPMIRCITKDDTLTDDTDADDITTKLLMADPFNLTYTPTNINSIEHAAQ